MARFFAFFMLACMAFAQFAIADATSDRGAGVPSASTSKTAPSILPALPPPPPGKSTVIGGSIRDVDHVRDQLTLKIFGGGSMKILFDARTAVYRDGVKSSVLNLHPESHASVETILDGTKVYARSIHILTNLPEGELQGQVMEYDPGTGELTVNTALSQESIELRVPSGTPVLRQGQAASSSGNTATSSDLVKGTLISVKFQSGTKGKGIARQIAILATPGSAFVFRGDIAALDMHAKRLVIEDPRDGKHYRILFDPAQFSASHDLRVGTHVAVTASFNGTDYVASAIHIE